VFLKVYEAPWPFGFGVLGSSLVMAFQSFGQVLSAADIVTLIFFGLEDIYEEGHVCVLLARKARRQQKSLSHER